MGLDTVDPFKAFCPPEKPPQQPTKYNTEAETSMQTQINHNLMNKKMGVKSQPNPLEHPNPKAAPQKSLPSMPIATGSLPSLPKTKEAVSAPQTALNLKEQEELGKRKAAEEQWDFENREINKKLSAVKSSGSVSLNQIKSTSTISGSSKYSSRRTTKS